VVVVRTKAGKLFGLHSANGDVIWARYVGLLAPGAPPADLREVFVGGARASGIALKPLLLLLL